MAAPQAAQESQPAQSSLKPLLAYIISILNPELKQAERIEAVGFMEQLIISREAGRISLV